MLLAHLRTDRTLNLLVAVAGPPTSVFAHGGCDPGWVGGSKSPIAVARCMRQIYTRIYVCLFLRSIPTRMHGSFFKLGGEYVGLPWPRDGYYRPLPSIIAGALPSPSLPFHDATNSPQPAAAWAAPGPTGAPHPSRPPHGKGVGRTCFPLNW